MGANHNGSIDMAKRLIDKAVDAGADAIKVQTWQADKFISSQNNKNEWLNIDFLKKYEFKLEWIEELIDYCYKKKILFFSTPSDYSDIDLLEEFEIPLYKWGGVQITDHPKLKYLATKEKPIIISSGGSSIEEIREALKVIEDQGNKKIILLQCTTSYPCDYDKIDLKVIEKFRELFPYPIGFSGHSLSIFPAIASISLGACVVEKHLTINRNLEGPDHPFALEPEEFKMMIQGIRIIEKALGNKEKKVYEGEKKIIEKGRRSIIAKLYIPKNTVIKKNMLDTARPASGIAPTLENFEKKIPGMKAKVDINSKQIITWDMIVERD